MDKTSEIQPRADARNEAKPFRLVSRLRNHRLVLARERLGYTTAIAAGRMVGVSYNTLRWLEKLEIQPRRKDGSWTKSALRIAAAYGAAPEHFWPREVSRVEKTVSVTTADVATRATRTLDVPAISIDTEDSDEST